MGFGIIWTVILSALISIVFSASIPFQKCDIADEACTKKSAQAFLTIFAEGIKELGIEPLDVMHVDEIKVELAGLILNMKNIDIKGLKKATIDNLSIDMAKKQMHLVYHSDIRMKGQYKAGGRLLILPITGDGEADFTLNNIVIDLTIPFKITQNEKGKDVIELSSYKYKYEIKNSARFYLSNLFNGNKTLSGVMLSFMNENWQILMQEFGRPVLETPVKKIFSAIKTYLKSQPLENIAS